MKVSARTSDSCGHSLWFTQLSFCYFPTASGSVPQLATDRRL